MGRPSYIQLCTPRSVAANDNKYKDGKSAICTLSDEENYFLPVTCVPFRKKGPPDLVHLLKKIPTHKKNPSQSSVLPLIKTPCEVP